MANGEVTTDANTRIYLQPIAAPSILGLYGLAEATFMVAAHMAHWFGDATTSLYLFPFAIFGGLAQFLAGSTTAAIGEFIGAEWLMILTGWLFIIAAIAAWYTASALMLEEAFGRELWGLGKSKLWKQMPPVSTGAVEPGVIRGQA
ncbi:MAG TPA: GPR1/FUN34/YaaH family transporter [Bryobacteraceae bacterium]|nr:GPR1/FUN34/YaaH family transporter [Bryobacteraceae bacterium]